MKIKYEDLWNLVNRILISNGLPEDEARPVVDEILFAEARGKTSHGLNMVQVMIKRISKPQTDLIVLKETPTTYLIDGGGKVGPYVAKLAMDKAIEKAKEYGISIAGVRNPSPFMTAGYNAWRAAEKHNIVSINLSVAKSKVAPFGTTKTILGTNPIGFGFPSETHPIVIDMAITKIPAADVKLAKKEGRKLPDNVAFDSEGNTTIDPEAALSGALIPFGGYKGSALGIFVELMCGALLDVKCGLRNGIMRSMLFIAIQGNVFSSFETIKKLSTQLREDVHNSGNNAHLPGDRADEMFQDVMKNGFIIPDDIYKEICSFEK